MKKEKEWTVERAIQRGSISLEIKVAQGERKKLYSASLGRTRKTGSKPRSRFFGPDDIDAAIDALQEMKRYIAEERSTATTVDLVGANIEIGDGEEEIDPDELEGEG